MSRTAPAPIRIAPPPDGWAPARARPARRQRSKDRPTAAMVFGIVSLVWNPLLLPSLIGILYGAASLRAGTTRRGRAIAGIVCGGLGGLVGVGVVVLAVLAYIVLPGVLADQTEQAITASSARAGAPVTAVDCPPVVLSRATAVIVCTGVADGVGPVSITATISTTGPTTFRAVPVS